MKCRYAVNAVHDDERERRAKEGGDEEEWSAHCNEVRKSWPTGAYTDRCGKDAVILVIHRNKDVIPYCPDCFAADFGVVNGYALLVWIDMAQKYIDYIREKCPYISVGFLEFAPKLETFMEAVETWLDHPHVLKQLIAGVTL